MAVIPQTAQICQRCSRPLEPGALACSNCHALVHADEMERLAAQARELEGRKDPAGARERWLSVLPLLPPESQQAEWIRGHVHEMEAAPASAVAGQHPSVLPDRSDMKRTWTKRLAPLGAVGVILAKFKTLLFAIFKLKFLFSFAAFIGFYWAAWGMKFGIGFALLVLAHELGHFIEIKRRGLPADLPVFLPGLGAYVRWQNMGVSLEGRSVIALAGPCAGFVAAVFCGLVWWQTGDAFWAALARTSAWFNVLNLIPVFIFDGAHAAEALSKLEKVMLMAVSVGLYCATSEFVFILVGAGTVWNLISAYLLARSKNTVTALDLSSSGQAALGQGGYAQEQSPQASSPLIAAYFIALLAALGAVMYLLPGHGLGLS